MRAARVEPVAARVRYDLARDMRVRLAAARRRGVDFDAAWQDGWASITWPRDVRTRADWRVALSETEPEWRSAYDGRPSPAADVLVALASRLAA